MITRAEAEQAMSELLRATVVRRSAVASRDYDVLKVQERHAGKIAAADLAIAAAEQVLEQYVQVECVGDVRHIDLACGRIGRRAPAIPALVLLDEAKWTWAKVANRLKRLYKDRFFRKAPPAPVDKVKIKSSLDAEQLAAVGLKLDDTEHFYYELNQLNQVEEAA